MYRKEVAARPLYAQLVVEGWKGGNRTGKWISVNHILATSLSWLRKRSIPGLARDKSRDQRLGIGNLYN